MKNCQKEVTEWNNYATSSNNNVLNDVAEHRLVLIEEIKLHIIDEEKLEGNFWL